MCARIRTNTWWRSTLLGATVFAAVEVGWFAVGRVVVLHATSPQVTITWIVPIRTGPFRVFGHGCGGPTVDGVTHGPVTAFETESGARVSLSSDQYPSAADAAKALKQRVRTGRLVGAQGEATKERPAVVEVADGEQGRRIRAYWIDDTTLRYATGPTPELVAKLIRLEAR
jgi:hypothetical protein